MALVSVIVPAYNAEGFIGNCIGSILGQTFQDFEIVVVNDGSTDSTLEVLRHFAGKDERIKVIDQKNGGVSAARNIAMQHATGEYLTMVDADDALPPTALEDMVGLMKEDVDWVIGSHNQVRLGIKPYLEKPDCFKASEIEERFQEFDPLIWFPWAKMFRHSIIKENGLKYDTNITYGEDHIFNLAYAKHMKGVAIATDKILYNYYCLRGGLCAKYYPDRHELQKYVLNGLFHFFGGVDKVPQKYHTFYVGGYLTGCIDYYCAWCNRKEAIQKNKETFEVYEEFFTTEILNKFFTPSQREYLANKDFSGFTRDYIRTNPKGTIWRKIKRKIRICLEKFFYFIHRQRRRK